MRKNRIPHDWHSACLCSPPSNRTPRARRHEGRRIMDSLRQDLEQRRTALTRALQTTMRTTREVADRAEMTKDPYGSASSSHDDEMAAITVDRLARDLKLIDRALFDYDAG